MIKIEIILDSNHTKEDIISALGSGFGEYHQINLTENIKIEEIGYDYIVNNTLEIINKKEVK